MTHCDCVSHECVLKIIWKACTSTWDGVWNHIGPLKILIMHDLACNHSFLMSVQNKSSLIGGIYSRDQWTSEKSQQSKWRRSNNIYWLVKRQQLVPCYPSLTKFSNWNWLCRPPLPRWPSPTAVVSSAAGRMVDSGWFAFLMAWHQKELLSITLQRVLSRHVTFFRHIEQKVLSCQARVCRARKPINRSSNNPSNSGRSMNKSAVSNAVRCLKNDHLVLATFSSAILKE